MNAGFALIPVILIRFGLMALVNKEALKRAAYFPRNGIGKAAYWVYHISQLAMFIYFFFLSVNADSYWFYAGLAVYIIGTVLYAVSVIDFARPAIGGINKKGLYSISRNPMYAAFFIYFLGCAMMTRSLILLAILIIFQTSSHFIILAEERWCIGKFGEEYLDYKRHVRRYI